MLKGTNKAWYSPNIQDGPQLSLRVGLRGNDQQPVKDIDGNAVRALVVCTPNLGDPTVGGDDKHGGHLVLQRPIQEGEALDVQHVHLVDEQHARHNVCLALFRHSDTYSMH